MKHITFVSLLLVILVSLHSCKKSTSSPKYPLVGLWIGTQVPEDGSGTTPLYYSVDFESDSTIQTSGLGGDGNTYYSKGTWTLVGSSLSASLTVTGSYQSGLKQNFTGTYNSSNGTITNGELVNVGTQYHGTITLARIN